MYGPGFLVASPELAAAPQTVCGICSVAQWTAAILPQVSSVPVPPALPTQHCCQREELVGLKGSRVPRQAVGQGERETVHHQRAGEGVGVVRRLMMGTGQNQPLQTELGTALYFWGLRVYIHVTGSVIRTMEPLHLEMLAGQSVSLSLHREHFTQ